MKRCNECRRDYYDDSLLYCFDDGTALLDGPASMDGTATAILHETESPSEAKTRAQIHATEQTAVLPRDAEAGTPDRAEMLRKAFRTGGWQGFREKQLEMQMERGDQARVSPWFYANHYTRMGRKDQAFTWLEKSFARGEMGNLRLKIDPLYDVLRDDPRNAQLLARIGLTP